MNQTELSFYEEVEKEDKGITFYCQVHATGIHYYQGADYETQAEEDVLYEKLKVEKAFYYDEEGNEIEATQEELDNLESLFDVKGLLLSTLS